jgi:release factor glutamine methyltransferase
VSEPWTVRRVVEWAAGDLRTRGSTSPRLDAEVLLAHVLGVDRVRLIIDSALPLGQDELARYRALHQRRRGGEPVAYLIGVREFFGRPFRVDARVLVPRPETELLVEVALARTRERSLSARVLDLCTGSGCVAITLGRERPTTQVLATDLSEDALRVAADNALRLGASNVAFQRADLFQGVARPDGWFELITANPPYIADGEERELPVDVRAFEPRMALFAGSDGLDLVRRIVAEAPQRLAPGGVLAMEIGAGQAPAVRALLEAAGFEEIEAARDLARHERVVSGKTARTT